MNQANCSFCDKTRDLIGFLIEKPGVSICNECVTRFNELLKNSQYGEKTQLYEQCSFCFFMKTMPALSLAGTTPPKKGERLVRHMQFCICDECLDVCQEIAEEHKAS
jgi:ATP-dependent protease Clp ATPase subunit